MEYLASDALNIKELLFRMWKFIAGKSIDNSKANNFKNLMGMGKALWKFISMVYELHWDALYMDNNNMTLRNKVKSQFSPQVMNNPVPNKGKDIAKPTFVSSIPLPILAKIPKEVKEISKFFKKIEKPGLKKSYT